MKRLLLSVAIATGVAHGADLPADLLAAAQAEGRVDSVGMPDTWANWKDTWDQLKDNYGIEHSDTDMSSAEEITKFATEGKNASADIGDVGIEFGDFAVAKGVTQAYKTSYWDDVPAWAKDEDGHWMLAYTGSMAFVVDNNQLAEGQTPPTSWAELKDSGLRVTMGGVGAATQSNSAVLSAAFAMGGDESNLAPAYDYFAEIAKAGNLSRGELSKATLEKGEIQVGLWWDFNALSYTQDIDRERFTVLIPSDGSVISGYTTIINSYAKHPNAAKLAREYIFSDQGQINLAKGNARPIRSNVELPAEIAEKLLPQEMYVNVRPIADQDAWEQSTKSIGRNWQQKVLVHAN